MKVSLVSIPVQDPVEAHEIYDKEMKRLEAAGVRVRPDLDKPEWGLKNIFEDGCGDLLMLQDASA